ncbi:adenosine deaminase [Talaromyces pinophilus]|uniref:Adenosine deaminase n=1 Tax=Talaromyces pinophilus TaxID=128442 RepID=A0A6V8H091_TALPI|nr:adenosine deaminase [Talaromyces pinophilus]
MQSIAMSPRVNPPRRVRRKLYHNYLSWAEFGSAVTANSTTDEENTVTEASRSESETERPLKFIVALDFGTTNTSVSYVKFDPEKGPGSVHSTNIKSIRGWPDAVSGQNQASDHNANVPSESWYLDGEYIWGYAVQQRMSDQLAQDFKPSQDVIKFSKLLLNHNKKPPMPLRKQLKRLKKSVHEVITDYLTQIFTHTKKELIEEENFSDTCAVELVLCLPAGWSFATQRDMQRIMEDVAKEVDFGWRDFEPFIINEPEAVAAYLLESMDPSDALKGDDIPPKIISERMALHFKESIEGTIELLRKQKETAAAEKKEDVAKIILAGGFSSSNALQERVKEEFPGVNILTPKKLQLTVFLWNISDVSTIVSHGAVFRALNKENGPERTIMASFGLLQDERYNDKFEGHALHYITQGTMDPAEGWATNVIEWLIKMHFDIGDDWIVRQRIYSSPDSVRDHYHIEHYYNAKAEVAGIVEANLNEYRDNGSIQPKLASNDKEYFSLEYEIVLEVNGRNIRAKLFYPPGEECRDELKICISAYFRAGTK